MSGTTGAPPAPLATDAVGAAAMFGLSRAMWFKLASTGRVPRPRRLGRRVLYDIAELRAWWGAGAPAREVWDAMRARVMGRDENPITCLDSL